jgi:hypothetical protein
MGCTLESYQAGPTRLTMGRKKNESVRAGLPRPRYREELIDGGGISATAGFGVGEEGLVGGEAERCRSSSSFAWYPRQLKGWSGTLGSRGGHGGGLRGQVAGELEAGRSGRQELV